MVFEQVRDILDQIKLIHRQAASHCFESEHSSDERVNLLMEYFRQWEEALRSWVESVESSERSTVLDTWVQFGTTREIDEALTSLRGAQREGPDALVSRSLELQQEIVEFLRQLAGSLDTPDAHNLVLDLAEFEEGANRRLGMAVLTSHDA